MAHLAKFTDDTYGEPVYVNPAAVAAVRTQQCAGRVFTQILLTAPGAHHTGPQTLQVRETPKEVADAISCAATPTVRTATGAVPTTGPVATTPKGDVLAIAAEMRATVVAVAAARGLKEAGRFGTALNCYAILRFLEKEEESRDRGATESAEPGVSPGGFPLSDKPYLTPQDWMREEGLI